MRLLLPLVVLSLACKPTVDLDDTGASAGGGTEGQGHSTAVLATVAEDYSVGALATVSLDDWTVSDQLVDVSGDAATVASGDHVYHLDRYGFDTVRIYEPGEWSAPAAEFALEDLANPQDVAVCDGQALISQYGVAELSVRDPADGDLLGTVDLSGHADADGIPEASSMIAAPNGQVYVGLHHYDRDNGWVTAGGSILEVDCASLEVTQSWSITTPTLYENPGDPDIILISTDGEGIWSLDTDSAELRGPHLTEATLGGRVNGLAASGNQATFITETEDEDYSYRIGCLDLDSWSHEVLAEPGQYLYALDGNDRGEAWISARTHFFAGEDPAPAGSLVVDIEACELLTETPIETLLAPVSITFY